MGKVRYLMAKKDYMGTDGAKNEGSVDKVSAAVSDTHADDTKKKKTAEKKSNGATNTQKSASKTQKKTASTQKKASNTQKTAQKTKKSTESKKSEIAGAADDAKKVVAKTHVRKKKTPESQPVTPAQKPQEQARAKNNAPKKAKGTQYEITPYDSARTSLASTSPRALKKRERGELASDNTKLRIIPLGGLNEIGKNMTVVEYGDDIIIIDCGLGFPDEEMPGIDLVIPDTTYLEENRDRIRGIVLTHGHEDHIGAIPYVLRNINPPIFGTKLTLGIVKNKLKEVVLPYTPRLICVNAGDTVPLGKLSCEFIHVNHSIADACALAIRTPLGIVLHSGDFKLDLTPIDGEIMDLTRLGEIGREGVLLLMCESTNAQRAGMTPSEKKVGASLEYLFTVNHDKRIVIATFSSNVHRVQQIIDTAYRHKRKVAITGRSMLNIVGAAIELGYMNVPEGVLIDISEIKKYSPHEVTLVTTGSQGEPMSALYRMAFNEHREVQLGASDVVILSSSAIPGNEKLIGKIVNELLKLGAKVIHDASVEVHVSGHACQEEIKLLHALTKPKYCMPVHGEYKHMLAGGEIAKLMGMSPENVFISDIGKVLEIDAHKAKFNGTVSAGKLLVDGYGVGDVGNIVLRDRILLSQDGLIVIVATVSSDGGYVLSGPDIVSRGFVYVRESDDLMGELRRVALDSITSSLEKNPYGDWYKIKGKLKDDVSKFIFSKTKRRPMVIPMIMNV